MHHPVERPAPRRPRPPPLVGRDREQALLREQLAAALAGTGGLVLIGGEAGSGKTVLLQALRRAALTGRCCDRSETPPYGPWRDLLGQTPATGHRVSPRTGPVLVRRPIPPDCPRPARAVSRGQNPNRGGLAPSRSATTQ